MLAPHDETQRFPIMPLKSKQTFDSHSLFVLHEAFNGCPIGGGGGGGGGGISQRPVVPEQTCGATQPLEPQPATQAPLGRSQIVLGGRQAVSLLHGAGPATQRPVAALHITPPVH